MRPEQENIHINETSIQIFMNFLFPDPIFNLSQLFLHFIISHFFSFFHSLLDFDYFLFSLKEL